MVRGGRRSRLFELETEYAHVIPNLIMCHKDLFVQHPIDLADYKKTRTASLGRLLFYLNKNSGRALKENLRKIHMVLLDSQNQRISNLKLISFQSLE